MKVNTATYRFFTSQLSHRLWIIPVGKTDVDVGIYRPFGHKVFQSFEPLLTV